MAHDVGRVSARMAGLRAVLRVTVGGIFPAPVPAGAAWAEQPREAPAAGIWAGERTTAAGSPGVPTPARRAAPHRRKPRGRLPVWGGWPLLAVLAAQTLLSLRLVRADTAFQDEATYLWAGHLQWAHWLHGAPVPPFPAYFSGAPVIYPPLAAVADNLGGLTGARVMSLVF